MLYSTGRQAAAVVTSDSELRGEGLASRLLMTLQVVVSPPHRLGGVPHGTRVIAPIAGGSFEGPPDPSWSIQQKTLDEVLMSARFSTRGSSGGIRSCWCCLPR